MAEKYDKKIKEPIGEMESRKNLRMPESGE